MSVLEAKARRLAANYEVRFFDDIRAMHDAIRQRDRVYGLSRLVAGYGWGWKSKNDPNAVDIEIDGHGLHRNKTTVDWIASLRAVDQVGSIHTVQGHDLNYAGVIIGNDPRIDPSSGNLVGVRKSYFDKRGKQNDKLLGTEYSDSDLSQYIADICRVLLTRGIRGTYLYVEDPVLRQHLQARLCRAGRPEATSGPGSAWSPQAAPADASSCTRAPGPGHRDSRSICCNGVPHATCGRVDPPLQVRHSALGSHHADLRKPAAEACGSTRSPRWEIMNPDQGMSSHLRAAVHLD